MIFATGELQSWAMHNQSEQKVRLSSEKLPPLLSSFEHNIQESIYEISQLIRTGRHIVRLLQGNNMMRTNPSQFSQRRNAMTTNDRRPGPVNIQIRTPSSTPSVQRSNNSGL